MAFLTLSILSLVALSLAQNQTVSLFLPDTDTQSLVGSIVGGDATATTYVIECANGASNALAALTAAAATTDGAAAATTDGAAATTDLGDDDSDACGYPVPITVVEGPSSVAFVMALEDNTVSANCVLSASSVAVCTQTAIGTLFTQNSLPTLTTGTYSGTDFSYMPVVITAGSVDKTASTPTSTTASATGTAKGGSTTSTGSAKSNSGTPTQTGSTTSASTQASGAAMHMGPAMGMGAAGALAAVAAVVL